MTCLDGVVHSWDVDWAGLGESLLDVASTGSKDPKLGLQVGR